MQAHGYVRPREMQSARDLLGLTVFQVAEPHDVAEGRRQFVDRFEQHAGQFAEVQGRLGGRGIGEWSRPRLGSGGFLVASCIGEPLASFRHEAVCRLVAYDGSHPRTCGRTALVLPELLQHDNPALLERVVGRCVIACDPPSERQEPGRAAPDPRFGVLLEERAPDRFVYRRPRRRRLRHGSCGVILARRYRVASRMCSDRAAPNQPTRRHARPPSCRQVVPTVRSRRSERAENPAADEAHDLLGNRPSAPAAPHLPSADRPRSATVIPRQQHRRRDRPRGRWPPDPRTPSTKLPGLRCPARAPSPTRSTEQ